MTLDRPLESAEYSWETPYSEPEKFGLELVAEMDEGMPYQFDMFVVWRDIESSNIYYGTDAGCSCPAPFDELKRMSDLTRVDVNHWLAFEQAVEKWRTDTYDERPKVTTDELRRFFEKVTEALA